MRNQDVAKLLEGIADLLTLKGENDYRARAFRNAARVVATLPEDVEEVYRQHRLEQLPGVGKTVTAVIGEYLRTGRSSYYEGLEQEVPPAAAELLAVPGIGPARARILFRELGITSLKELEEAAREKQLTRLFGEATSTEIGRELDRLIQRLRRVSLGTALPVVEHLAEQLRRVPGIDRIEIVGSLRRMRDTVGDFDILVSTRDPEDALEAFVHLPEAKEVLARGPTHAVILLPNQMEADLWVTTPADYGAALVSLTGSSAHEIALHSLAQEQGMKLTPYGLFRRDNGQRIAGETEEGIYHALGLPWIPPELREGRGEIEAARHGQLPQLITPADVKGDLHAHTDWSEGADTLQAMATAAMRLGYEYLAIADHSRSLRIANGLSIERIREQGRQIAQLNARLAPFRLLHGAEVDILPDGTLDYPDEVLAELDVVVASVHSRFRQPEQQMTARIVRALHNPYVTILGHPRGRMIGKRPGYAVDLSEVARVAAQQGVALEINGQPARLDLDDVWARRARHDGARLACDSDAHSVAELEYMRYAVAMARRAWLSAKDVLNTRPRDELLAILKCARRKAA